LLLVFQPLQCARAVVGSELVVVAGNDRSYMRNGRRSEKRSVSPVANKGIEGTTGRKAGNAATGLIRQGVASIR
jgi:hypothetical protein